MAAVLVAGGAGYIGSTVAHALADAGERVVVPESVRDPLKYYDNNVGRSRALIAACLAAEVRRFVFSSSAAVYGAPARSPIGEAVELAQTHLAALLALRAGHPSVVLNCGYGRGSSVREVAVEIERVAGLALDLRAGLRRAGDPPEPVADPSRLRAMLDWRPRRDSREAIVRDALAWERRMIERGPP